MINSFVQLLVLLTGIYLCVYTIIDRICNCIEKVTLMKSFAKYVKKTEKSMKEVTSDYVNYKNEYGK